MFLFKRKKKKRLNPEKFLEELRFAEEAEERATEERARKTIRRISEKLVGGKYIRRGARKVEVKLWFLQPWDGDQQYILDRAAEPFGFTVSPDFLGWFLVQSFIITFHRE